MEKFAESVVSATKNFRDAAPSSSDVSASKTAPENAANAINSCAVSSDATCAFLLDENPSVGKGSLARIFKANVTAAALAVGCEGGMSEQEKKVLLEAGFMPLHFMTNVLRAETASLYGIAVIQQFLFAD